MSNIITFLTLYFIIIVIPIVSCTQRIIAATTALLLIRAKCWTDALQTHVNMVRTRANSQLRA